MNHEFPLLDTLLDGETLQIEYKRDLDSHNKGGPYSDDAIAEALMAISNQDGGHLLLGVDDKGNITGVNPNRDGRLALLGKRVARKFVREPLLAVHRYDDPRGSVIAIYVQAAAPPPHQLQNGVFKIRKDMGHKQGPQNVAFPLSELPQWEAQRGYHNDLSSTLLSDLPLSQYEKFLNPLAVDIFQRRIAEGTINNPSLRSVGGLEQQLDALGVTGTTNGKKVLTHAALLLFGSNDIIKKYIPTHTAQFQAFAPDGSVPYNLSTGRPGLDSFCLIYLAERLGELFRGVVPRREWMDQNFRIDIPAYGDDALRESAMNAFIHRDYTMSEPVIIQITPEHFTVTNAGGFYRDVRADNILFHEPCPRNKCLAQACTDIGLMERSGRGVDRIFWDQIRFLRPMPSYAETTADTVRLTLLGGQGALENIHWMLTYFAKEKDLRIRVIHGGLMHALITEGEANREALIATLPGLGQTFGRKAITELIDSGLITRIGHGRAQRLVLSAKFQEDRGKPEAFVHQLGQSLEEQRERILQYVDEHGSITRGEAARHLGIEADNTVYRLLLGLVRMKRLEKVGNLNKARYQRPKV
jgi:ATP-dependent DNA helicase RecG